MEDLMGVSLRYSRRDGKANPLESRRIEPAAVVPLFG
jgi:hypothetical protein